MSEKDRQLEGQNGTHYYHYHKIAEKNTAKSAQHGYTEQNSNSQVSKCIKPRKKGIGFGKGSEIDRKKKS